MTGKPDGELQNLHDAKYLLKAISRAVAHDVKSPLGGLIGIIDLMKEDCASKSLTFEKMDEYINMMSQSSDRLLAIVESLQLLTKIGFTEEIIIEHVDLLNIIRRAKQRVQPDVDVRGGKLIIPKNCPEARGSILWLGEIIVNFMSNGIKYGGSPPVVAVQTEQTEDGYVMVSVADNGAGIPDEKKGHIFDLTKNDRRIKVDGLGIGLPYAKQIAEKLGGMVGVEDSAAGGSLFWVKLPAVMDDSGRRIAGLLRKGIPN